MKQVTEELHAYTLRPSENLTLGSPVAPFTLFIGYGFPYKVTNRKRGRPYYNMGTGLPRT